MKNEIVDAILNYYEAQFDKRECSFIVNGNLPQRCCVQAFDLCSIFSNLMSNALESVEQSRQKSKVELSVHFDDEQIYIREKNTCDKTLIWRGNEIVSTKPNQELHGFGIRIIRDSVKKYSGTVDIKVTDYMFVLDIVMDNRTPLNKVIK